MYRRELEMPRDGRGLEMGQDGQGGTGECKAGTESEAWRRCACSAFFAEITLFRVCHMSSRGDGRLRQRACSVFFLTTAGRKPCSCGVGGGGRGKGVKEGPVKFTLCSSECSEVTKARRRRRLGRRLGQKQWRRLWRQRYMNHAGQLR